MEAETTKTDAKGEKPWPIIIMLAMLFIVIAAGLILAPKSEEAKLRWLNILGTTNHGEFLNPPMSVQGMLRGGELSNWTDDEDKPWKLVLVNTGTCELACQEMADVAARVHVRLNRAAPEMKRGFLYLPDSAAQGDQTATGVAPDFDLGYDMLALNEGADLDFLQQAGVPSFASGPVLLVIDPLQVAFMYYLAEHEGNGMLEDIEHVMELAH